MIYLLICIVAMCVFILFILLTTSSGADAAGPVVGALKLSMYACVFLALLGVTCGIWKFVFDGWLFG